MKFITFKTDDKTISMWPTAVRSVDIRNNVVRIWGSDGECLIAIPCDSAPEVTLKIVTHAIEEAVGSTPSNADVIIDFTD